MKKLEIINERLRSLEKRIVVLEDYKQEEKDFDMFEVPSEKVRSRAVPRSEVEATDKVDWIRTESGFEVILGKFVLRKTLSLMRGPMVLDVGCGDGFLTRKVAKRYDKVVGIDASKDNIEIARKNAPEVEFHVSLFEDFKYDEKINSIMMINVLEHVNDPVHFLGKARDLLALDGEIVIFVPNALSLNRRIGKAMGLVKNCYELTENDLAVGHKRFYDMRELRKDVLESGLKVVEEGGVFLKPLSNSQMESWDPDIFEALYEVGMELSDYCGLIYVVATLSKGEAE